MSCGEGQQALSRDTVTPLFGGRPFIGHGGARLVDYAANPFISTFAGNLTCLLCFSLVLMVQSGPQLTEAVGRWPVEACFGLCSP